MYSSFQNIGLQAFQRAWLEMHITSGSVSKAKESLVVGGYGCLRPHENHRGKGRIVLCHA
eukprot:9370984-Pyramimonas_sp.AAC.1